MQHLAKQALDKFVEGAAAYCRSNRFTDEFHNLDVILEQQWRNHSRAIEQSIIQAALPLLREALTK